MAKVGVMGTIKKAPAYVKEHWNKPLKPTWSMGLKEMVTYCIGAMGSAGVVVVPNFLAITYGVYMSVVLDFTTDEIFIFAMVVSIIAILRTPFVSWIIDNVNSKYGKFRVWLITMPIPALIGMVALAWIPYNIDNHLWSIISYGIIYNIMMVFITLYTFGFNTLLQVISPSLEERTFMMSAGAIVYSLGPSIFNAIIPLLANLFFASVIDGVKQSNGINMIGTFQYIIPIVSAVFFAVGLIMAFNTKERMVIPKAYKQRVKLLDGIKKAFKNRLFLVANTANIFNLLKLTLSALCTWVCVYLVQESWAQTIFITLLGTACVPGMALAPILIKKFGKKKLVIGSNILVVTLTALAGIMVFFRVAETEVLAFLLIAMMFVTTMSNSVQLVTLPAMTAMVYDNQQYKTGDRLEGFMSQFGEVITLVGGLALAYITPAVYKACGYTDSATVLYNIDVIYPIIYSMCGVGVIAGILTTIPYLFWNVSEKDHDKIMEILKVRAVCDNGKCDAEECAELETRILAGEMNLFAERFPEDVATVNRDDELTLAEEMRLKDKK
ncbi:MAG: MFS transporter [Bacillota bacterium]